MISDVLEVMVRGEKKHNTNEDSYSRNELMAMCTSATCTAKLTRMDWMLTER